MTPIAALIFTYKTLLKHPHDAWRIQNQRVLCVLRDSIAEATGSDSQTMQETFESETLR